MATLKKERASIRSNLLSSRTLQWTTSSTPATAVGSATARSCAPDYGKLTKGVKVKKITSRGKLKPRVVTVANDYLAIFCTHQGIDSAKGLMSSVASKLPLPSISRKGVWGLTGDLREKYVRYIDVADLDYVTSGAVSSRRLEYTRTKNRLRGADSKVDEEKSDIVVVGHHGNQTFDVLVKNAAERDKLVNCLKEMQTTYKSSKMECSHESLLLRYIWYDVDANRDGKICLKEFRNILARINCNVKGAKKMYNKFCKDCGVKPSKGLTLEQILLLLGRVKEQHGNVAGIVWQKVFGKADAVSSQEFLVKFSHAEQGETELTEDHIRSLFRRINSMDIDGGVPGTAPISNTHLSRQRFELYLFHELNAAYSPQAMAKKTKRLDLPISRYFINTSHNTYLTGDQLKSTSSVEMYDAALRRGCKCLELDCWDGDGKGGKIHPVVFHGHTLTTKILFSDILLIVDNYLGDFPDTYPIILSLENHCSHPYQSVMAKLLERTFGDKLYVPPETPTGELPSPERLRGMVVIKGKRPPEPDDAVDLSEKDEDDPYEGGNGGEKSSKAKGSVPPGKPPKIVKELARMTLFHGTKWKSFGKSIAEPHSHMHSIGESKIAKIIAKDNANPWREYNVHHMTRTYPAGARVDSSNYNPLVAWSVGSQLVALNFQTTDDPLVLNDGFFRRDGGVGYIEKPNLVGSATPKMRLSIQVMSGNCLPKPLGAKSGEYIDPYVVVTLNDVKEDEKGPALRSTSHSTSTITDNGFCPVWNDKGKTFDVYNPSLAMLHIALKESDIVVADDVGYAAIPISCLRSGYRSVQIYDQNNTRTGPFGFASLLMRISVETL